MFPILAILSAGLPSVVAAEANGSVDLEKSDWFAEVARNLRAEEYHLQPAPHVGGWTAPNRAHDVRVGFRSGEVSITARSATANEVSESFVLRLASVQRADQWVAVGTVIDEEVKGGELTWVRSGSVREQYSSDENGVTVRLTVERRPEGAAEKPVVLSADVESAYSPVPTTDGRGVTWRQGDVDRLRMAALRATDASGEEIEVCFEFAAGRVGIVIDDREARYPIDVDYLITGPVWTYTRSRRDNRMGRSVATAGDVNGDGYSDVLVGSPLANNTGGFDHGHVMAFHGTATGIEENPSWFQWGVEEHSSFGSSVATAGDVNGDGYSDVIIGAYSWTGPLGVGNNGAAFVFLGSASGLASTEAWRFESTQFAAWVGWSVSTAGDVNNDGYADVIVGAYPWDGAWGNQVGIAWVFHGSASGLDPNPSWTYEGTQRDARLGSSVSAAGDVNGDGYSDVIIGAWEWNGAVGSNEGAAFVFHGSSTGLGSTPDWRSEGGQLSARQGFAVSTAGDVNGDGYSDVIVDAWEWDGVAGFNVGAAFVYHGSASGLAAVPTWFYESDQPFALLGSSVSTAGDLNGDGYADIVVGAPQWDGAVGMDEGMVVAFYGSPAGIEAAPAWSYEGGEALAVFGTSVSTAGDVNGDGYSDLIVGAPLWGTGPAVDEGRVFAFHGSAAGLSSTPGWRHDGGQAGAQLGFSVSTAGDVNGDGYSDAVVGAYLWDGAVGPDEGAVFVMHGSVAGLATTAAWSYESGQVNAWLGSSVSTAGDLNGDGYSDVIVGALQWDGTAGDDEGAGFAFHGSASGLGAAPAWAYESGQVGARFGISVSTAGDVNGDGYSDAVVGAFQWDGSAGVDEGAAFLFHGSGTGLAPGAGWSYESGQANANLGVSVATAGDVNGDGYSDVIVGADRWDGAVGSDEGTTLVFHGTASGLATVAAWVNESGQPDARLGVSVNTAGDVNGDGYSDVIAGAHLWDGTVGADEGAAFVFHGSAAGLETTTAWSYESRQVGAWLGVSVAPAGDVNGDGYFDVIVGAYTWAGGAGPFEGAAFAFHGSAAGLATAPSWRHESGQAGARFARSVATAGDVNGDGYSDVIIGALGWDGGAGADEGSAFVFYGNDGDGLDRIPRQAQGDGSAPIDLLGRTPDGGGFLLRANGRSPHGRDRVRLEWEVEPLANPFDGVGIQVSDWFDSGPPGAAGSVVALEELHSLLPAPGAYKWRLRLRAAVSGFGVPGGATVTPFPWQSHWMSLPYNNSTETDLRVAGGGVLPCALNAVDLTTAPITPTRVGAWVYDLDCGAGTPDRLNPALAIGREVSPAPVRGTTTFDAASPGTRNTLSLYQVDCGCVANIQIVKSATTDELVLY